MDNLKIMLDQEVHAAVIRASYDYLMSKGYNKLHNDLVYNINLSVKNFNQLIKVNFEDLSYIDYKKEYDKYLHHDMHRKAVMLSKVEGSYRKTRKTISSKFYKHEIEILTSYLIVFEMKRDIFYKTVKGKRYKARLELKNKELDEILATLMTESENIESQFKLNFFDVMDNYLMPLNEQVEKQDGHYSKPFIDGIQGIIKIIILEIMDVDKLIAALEDRYNDSNEIDDGLIFLYNYYHFMFLFMNFLDSEKLII